MNSRIYVRLLAGMILVTNSPYSSSSVYAANSEATSDVCSEPVQIDYARRAKETNEWWPDRDPNLLESVIATTDPLEIELKHLERDHFEVRIGQDGKALASFQAHRSTCFKVCGRYLVYPDYNPSSSGGRIVAYDLAQQKVAWTRALEGIGPVDHSRYANMIFLDVIYGVVNVYGRESFGTYLEYLDLNTGKQLGHRIFQKRF
jgi:hypothetical protein